MDGAALAAQSMDHVALSIKPRQRYRYLRPLPGLNGFAFDYPGLRSDRWRGLRYIRGCQPNSPAGLADI